MLRSVTAFITAVALLAAQTGPSLAFDWRHSGVWSDARIHHNDAEREMVAKAYLRLPFARKADQDVVSYGLGLAARIPQSHQGNWQMQSWSEAPVMDLGFNANGFEDFKISGVGVRETQRRLNAAGDPESGIWWTLGVMLAVGLAAAAVVVFSESDGTPLEEAAAP